ncbi:MAG: hypothetical protein FWE03_07090 [Firmicutes bacterium]|nr:hypothetical protein [Bacillota bacterium]
MSGLLLFGASQKNRAIRIVFLTVLFITMLIASQNTAFFIVNIAAIFILTTLLRKFNFQLLNGAAILVYSVIIDILSFYLFPLFPIHVPLGTYILSGLMFNFSSAVPSLVFGGVITLLQVLIKVIEYKFKPAKNCCLLILV